MQTYYLARICLLAIYCRFHCDISNTSRNDNFQCFSDPIVLPVRIRGLFLFGDSCLVEATRQHFVPQEHVGAFIAQRYQFHCSLFIHSLRLVVMSNQGELNFETLWFRNNQSCLHCGQTPPTVFFLLFPSPRSTCSE